MSSPFSLALQPKFLLILTMVDASYSQLLLGLSLVAMVVGPLLYQIARVVPSMLAALDGFVFVAIGGLVLFHIIPDSIAQAGGLAVAVAFGGLVLPSIVERKLRGLANQAHVVALLLGLAALTLHGFTDGMALVPADHGENHGTHMLPMAVLLHRLPVGLTIWFLLRPVYGLLPAIATLVVTACATAAGFAFGESVAGALQSNTWGFFQAMVAGSLLHVLLHRSYPLVSTSPERVSPANVGLFAQVRIASAIGGFAGLALLAVINHDYEMGTSVSQGVEVFVSLALQTAPVLLFAYVAAGLVYAFLPQASVHWMRRGSSLSQAARGMGFGLPLPICSCGVVPVYRSLVVQGVPATAAMAFLVATPELSFDAVLISLPLLGGELTSARVIAAGVVALVVGWSVGRYVTPLVAPTCQETDDHIQPTFGERLGRFTESFWDVVDTTAPWILVGLGLAAVLEPNHATWVGLVPAGFGQVELFALLGMPVYVCASGATPLVAVLVHKGVSPGAALAFLLTGPATNITTFGILSQLHGRWVALAFGSAITGLAIVAGHVVNSLLPSVDVNPFDHAHSSLSGFQEICLLVLVGVLAVSVLRRGPREFVGELFETGSGNDAGDECTGHDYGSATSAEHGHVHATKTCGP